MSSDSTHKAVEVTLLISYNGGDLDRKCLNLNLPCVTLSVLPNTAKYGLIRIINAKTFVPILKTFLKKIFKFQTISMDTLDVT